MTDGEKDYVRNQSRENCLEDTALTFTNFKEDSLLMFGSASYPRDRSFDSILSDSGAQIEKRIVRIWKNTPEYIIFFEQEEIGSATNKKFIKVTVEDNNSMIDAIRSNYCAGLIDYAASSDTGPVTASKTTSIATISDGRKETKYNYSFNFSEIAYWEHYRKNHTVTEYDVNGIQLTSKTQATALTENTSYPVMSTDFATITTNLCYVDPASYGLPYVTTKCDVDYSADMTP